MVESLGATTTADLGARSTGARVILFGQVAAMKEIPTKSGDRMAFVTLEDMDGTVELTVFPAPFRSAAGLLRSREPVLVRGRVDDTEKGRVILAEEIRPLEQALVGGTATGGPPQTCRIRLVSERGDPLVVLPEIRRVVAEHPGPVPVFLHVVLAEAEVVVRAKEPTVDGSAQLVAKLESLLGPKTILLEYGRRA
jgi:DNA polymerase-3 subunit alpha